uniref:Major Capsid Protein n=1 Tax=Carcinus maenas virus 1 TaxID=2704945 RepID=A0A6G9HEC5_9VIRU|nr:major Capsid Protein [Carcinus maenas virus 1]
MASKVPVFDVARELSSRLMNELVKSKNTLSSVLYDLDSNTDGKGATSYLAKESFKLEPSVSTYMSRDDDLELGRSSTLHFEGYTNDTTYITELNISLTLPPLVIDTTKRPHNRTAIGYVYNFLHHYFDISLYLNHNKLCNITPTISDLNYYNMTPEKRKAYDECVGNTPDLLTSGVDETEGRLTLPSKKVVFPVDVGSLFPLMMQTQNSSNDRFRITIESKPFLDGILIRSLGAAATSVGNDIITKNDIRTINSMSQLVPLGDVKYGVSYKVNKTHYQFAVPKDGFKLYERLQEIDQRELKNIHENGESVEIYAGLHTRAHCMLKNVTKEQNRAITGSEQGVYGLNPDANGGGDVVAETSLKFHGNDHAQTLDNVFTQKMLPYRSFGVTYPSGIHLLYDYAYNNIELSNAINTVNLGPKLSFVFTDASKYNSWKDKLTEMTYKPKFETTVVISEICGLMYNPGKPTKFVNSKNTLNLAKVTPIRNVGDDDDATAAAPPNATNTDDQMDVL